VIYVKKVSGAYG